MIIESIDEKLEIIKLRKLKEEQHEQIKINDISESNNMGTGVIKTTNLI